MGVLKDKGDIIRIWDGTTIIRVGFGLIKGVDPGVVILPTTDNAEIEGITVTGQQIERAPVLLRRTGMVIIMTTGTITKGEHLICTIGGRFVTLTHAGNSSLVAVGEAYNVQGRALWTNQTGNWSYMDPYKVHIVRES